jgi:hypothetical protein
MRNSVFIVMLEEQVVGTSEFLGRESKPGSSFR